MPNFIATSASVASLTLLLASTSTLAQPKPLDTIDQAEAVPAVNLETVTDALAVVTGNHLAGADPQGNSRLIATATNGLRFEINFRACETSAEDEPTHCKGMYMISTWDPALPESKAALGEKIAEFLRDNPSVNAGLSADGSPYIVRYVIADYGTRQGNLVSEFANFIRSGTEFQNVIVEFY